MPKSDENLRCKDCPSKHQNPQVLMLAEAKELGCICIYAERASTSEKEN